MEALAAEEIRRVVQLALAEDVGDGDITTLATIAPNATAKGVMIAREPLVLAGLAVAEAVFSELSPAIHIGRTAKEGDHVTTGQFRLFVNCRLTPALADGILATVWRANFGFSTLGLCTTS